MPSSISVVPLDPVLNTVALDIVGLLYSLMLMYICSDEVLPRESVHCTPTCIDPDTVMIGDVPDQFAFPLLALPVTVIEPTLAL